MHEWWGVNESIEIAARKLNDLGYRSAPLYFNVRCYFLPGYRDFCRLSSPSSRVLVPDLFRGQRTTDWELASEIVGRLNYTEAVGDSRDSSMFYNYSFGFFKLNDTV